MELSTVREHFHLCVISANVYLNFWYEESIEWYNNGVRRCDPRGYKAYPHLMEKRNSWTSRVCIGMSMSLCAYTHIYTVCSIYEYTLTHTQHAHMSLWGHNGGGNLEAGWFGTRVTVNSMRKRWCIFSPHASCTWRASKYLLNDCMPEHERKS